MGKKYFILKWNVDRWGEGSIIDLSPNFMAFNLEYVTASTSEKCWLTQGLHPEELGEFNTKNKLENI